MKVFALGSFAKPITEEQSRQIMPRQVPDTLQLYLDGKIDQFWFREDTPGVDFLLNAASFEGAKAMFEALPLVDKGDFAYGYIPVDPPQPLALLIQSRQPE